jgi:hypothetical protein
METDRMTTRDAEAITALELPIPHVQRGKVREMFALGADLLLACHRPPLAFDIVSSGDSRQRF